MPNKVSDFTPVILAGGLGSRLKSVLSDLPKPLAPVQGRPFLTFLLNQLIQSGFEKAIVCTGYRGSAFLESLGTMYRSLKLTYSQETSPLGTGGALRQALFLTTTPYILAMNGDSLIDADLDEFIQAFDAELFCAAVLLTKVDDASRFGSVIVDDSKKIVSFQEKPGERNDALINAGVYVFSRSILEVYPSGIPISLEREVLPKLISINKVQGASFGGSFIDIGTPDSLAVAETFFSNPKFSRQTKR